MGWVGLVAIASGRYLGKRGKGKSSKKIGPVNHLPRPTRGCYSAPHLIVLLGISLRLGDASLSSHAPGPEYPKARSWLGPAKNRTRTFRYSSRVCDLHPAPLGHGDTALG